MRPTEWDPVYERILADMGYSREEDEACVRVLKAVTAGSDLVDPDDLRPMFAGGVTVLGGAARLEEDVASCGTRGLVVAAGSATGRALALGIEPGAVVTDLDGDVGPQLEASAAGAVTFIHAHGDNADLVRRWAGEFRGPVVLTTQSRPERTVFCFGGFTDGDRAVCIAEEMGAPSALLLGFDFDAPGPKAGSDPSAKLRKLRWAREVIGSLRSIRVEGPGLRRPGMSNVASDGRHSPLL